MPSRPGVRPFFVVTAVLLLASCGAGRDPGTGEAEQPSDPPPAAPEQPRDPVPVVPEEPTTPEVSAPLSYAVLGSAVKVRPQEFPTGPKRASIFAARNEFESFQVVVMAPHEPVRALRASFPAPLTGPDGAVIPNQNVTVYREGYYNVRTPSDLEGAAGLWPDPLLPAVDPLLGQTRNAFPIDVPVGENRTLWVDVQVPIDAPAGVYHGRLELTAEGVSMNIPVELKVLNFTLPSTTTLKSSFGFSPGHECLLGTRGCGTDPTARARAKELFVRSALDNRITLARAHATNLQMGSTTGIQEFRTHTLALHPRYRADASPRRPAHHVPGEPAQGL